MSNFDYRLALMTGVDIPIPQFQLILHQPTIKEISQLSEEVFFEGLHTLCLDKQQLIQDKTVLDSLTNFQVLMKVLSEKEAGKLKQSLIQVFLLLFQDWKTLITPNSIIFNNTETKESVLIDDKNFDEFQQVLKDMLCLNSIFQGDNVIYNPSGQLAQKIVDKIMQGRKAVAAIKNKKNESAFVRYLSILSVGLHIPVDQLTDMNMYQLFDLVERYTLWLEQDIDMRVRIAGGSPKQEPENWMKNIH